MPKNNFNYNNHHAYLVRSVDFVTPEFPAPAEVYHEKFALLGINDARRLRERQTTKALADGRRIFIITFSAMTEEAQNALLKTLEEPTAGTQFIFVTTSSASLLPTFLSRVQVLQTSDVGAALTSDVLTAKKFYQASPAERLAIVSGLIDADDENHKTVALKFVDELEKFLSKKIDLKKVGDDWHFVFRELRQARYYLQDKSGLPRQVLEHLALVVPRS